jgi:four helix bundle protein
MRTCVARLRRLLFCALSPSATWRFALAATRLGRWFPPCRYAARALVSSLPLCGSGVGFPLAALRLGCWVVGLYFLFCHGGRLVSYKNLRVWQGALEIAVEVLRLVESCQNYAFADQIRRSAISVPSNIAEGMTRDSEVEKNRFLSIAKASNAELETQLLIAKKLGYFSNDVCEELLKQVQKVNFQLYYLKIKVVPKARPT